MIEKFGLSEHTKNTKEILVMKKRFLAVILTGAMLVLAGCGSNKQEGQTVTPIPSETIMPTEEPTNAPEATAAPTEEPTNIPEVTAAPTEAPDAEDNTQTEEAVVTLVEYKGLTLYEVDSSVVAEEMHNMMNEFAEFVAVERAAVEGDTVNINYVGKYPDGVAFEGGTDDSEEGTDLELGSDSFIDGFEDGLIGAVAGEIRDLKLTFPENYSSEELAGKEVIFTVTVNAVMEKTVPEMTDAFVKENLGFQTTAELILALYDSLNMDSYIEQISETVIGGSTVENYPMDVIEEEKKTMIDYYTSNAEYYASMLGVDMETCLQYFFGISSLEQLEIYAETYAYSNVKTLLVLNEIAKLENLTLDDVEYQNRVLRYAVNYGYEDVATFEADYGVENIKEALLRDQVMEFIISQAVIVKAEGEYSE